MTESIIQAHQIVGDVVRQHPEGLQIMEQMGINHCCGAQLTLAESAAAAGVTLDVLLAALNRIVVRRA
jgi:iron-sulfur cluster repair protein YtfE (RIC family)